MILAAAALAFTLLRQEPSNSTFSSTVGGKEVTWSFQTPPAPTLTPDVLNWDGWGFLPAAGRMPYGLFRSYVLPAGLEERYKAAHARINASTPVWRTKIVFFRESDILDRGENGVVRRGYSTLEPFQVDEMMPAIARFAALVEVVTDGQLQVKTDVETDTTIMQFDRAPGGSPWDDRFAERYFAPRLNGPGPASDDEAYRGPYQSVFYIHPGLSSLGTVDSVVQETPVSGLSIWSEDQIPTAGSVDASLLLGWERHAHRIAGDRLAPADFRPSTQDWPLLTKPQLGPEEQAVLMTPRSGSVSVLRLFPRMFSMGPLSANVEAKIVNDPERGAVLSYAESGLERSGGLAAPVQPDAPLIRVKEKPILEFWTRSASSEPVAVTLMVNGQPQFELVLGRNDPAPATPDASKRRLRILPLPFKADGKWQRISLDLSKYLTDETGWAVSGLIIGPPSNSRRFGKEELGKVEYQFDDFTASKEPSGPLTPEAPPPEPSASAADEASKLLFLARLSNESSKADLEAAVRLLNDPNPGVKLNAVYAFTHAQYQPALIGLFDAARSIYPRLAQIGVRALAHQDTPTAWAIVRKVVENGSYDVAREEAARALGSLKDPTLAGALSTTVDSRSRYDKIAAIEALAGLPGDDAPQILMAFVNQDDPEVRLAVVRSAKVSMPPVRQIVLYTATNDVSDKVRAVAYQRLLESAERAEAYPALEDPAERVRLEVLEAISKDPQDPDRPAVRRALADESARVRAAALTCLSKLPKGIEEGEIKDLLPDANPLVQDALLDLAAARSVRLPESLLATLRTSKVPRIAAKAKAVS